MFWDPAGNPNLHALDGQDCTDRHQVTFGTRVNRRLTRHHLVRKSKVQHWQARRIRGTWHRGTKAAHKEAETTEGEKGREMKRNSKQEGLLPDREEEGSWKKLGRNLK